jgi:cob(I)alamin adenosyltransferase
MEQDIDEWHKEKVALRQVSDARQKASATRENGLIIVHTDAGRGKTTAAFGLAFRAPGQGMKVGMVQFIKGAMPTGEVALVKQLSLPIELYTLGEGFTWHTENRPQDIAPAHRAWEQAVQLLRHPAFDMVILDELNIVLRYDYLPLEEVWEALRTKREMLHVVITGRNEELIELADLVTDMKPIKHPYKAGIKAQRGVEF